MSKLNINGVVGQDVLADDFVAQLSEYSGQDIVISMNSEGGAVDQGLQIYNALMAHEGHVTVHVNVLAASIASVIMSAADKVVMNSNAKVMVHRAWTVAMGNTKDFQTMANLLDMLDQDIAAVYAERSGKDAEEWLVLMDNETYMTAEHALEMGIIDEVNQIKRDRKKSAKNEAKPLAGLAMAQAKAAAIRVRLKLDD